MQTSVKLNKAQNKVLASMSVDQVAGLDADVLKYILQGADSNTLQAVIEDARAQKNGAKVFNGNTPVEVIVKKRPSEMQFDELIRQPVETHKSMDWIGAMRLTCGNRRVIALNGDKSIDPDTSIDAFTKNIDKETWNGKRMVTVNQYTGQKPRYLPWSNEPIDPSSVWATLTQKELGVIYWAATKPTDRGGIANLETIAPIVEDDLANGNWRLFKNTLAAIERASEEADTIVEVAQCEAKQYKPRFSDGEASTEKNTRKPVITVGTVVDVDRKALRVVMTEVFGFNDLKILCDNMNISYEEIGGSNLSSKVLELVLYCVRRNRLVELAQHCVELRPDETFGATFAQNTAIAQGNNNVVVGNNGIVVQGNVFGSINTGTINTGGGDIVMGNKINRQINYY